MKYNINSAELKRINNARKHYQGALEYLESFDKGSLNKLRGTKSGYILTVEECVEIIENITGEKCDEEKINLIRNDIGALYKSFLGEEVYPSVEEKAANLLCFLLQEGGILENDRKNSALLFLYFLDRNGVLYENADKKISDKTLCLMSVLMSCVKDYNRDKIVTLISNFLSA